MKFRTSILLFLVLLQSELLQAQQSPDIIYGQLFADVQTSGIFPDSKTFADAIPKTTADSIVRAYQQQRGENGFQLKSFVEKYFIIPKEITTNYSTDTSQSIEDHINSLWDVLTRTPGNEGGSLIPLPYKYVVPGGRFREIYYWDSYFTMLGLKASGRYTLMRDMIDNFAYLIKQFGHIPNGNRTYYLSRSQPPFFSLMIDLLQKVDGDSVYTKYLWALEKEYNFWMNGENRLTETSQAYMRVVRLPDGTILNRYWDDQPLPRPESYAEDVQLAQISARRKEELYRNIRASCESGWDFSSRWFADGRSLATIHTTDIIPVDLNSLLYHLEITLSKAYKLKGDKINADAYQNKANIRKEAILKYCWNSDKNFFMDYDFVTEKNTPIYSLAGVFPLFFRIANIQQARKTAEVLQENFLFTGGLATTFIVTGQQWDAPNGWAPLQWISIQALQNYWQNELATEIKNRWIKNNLHVYKVTGKLVEKYNVLTTCDSSGGGEYPTQDGFGWTNGVFLDLLKQ